MLNQAGRLQITNAVFSSLPTYYMYTLEIPKAVIKQIDKFRKNCLWRGTNINGEVVPKLLGKWYATLKKKEAYHQFRASKSGTTNEEPG